MAIHLTDALSLDTPVSECIVNKVEKKDVDEIKKVEMRLAGVCVNDVEDRIKWRL